MSAAHIASAIAKILCKDQSSDRREWTLVPELLLLSGGAVLIHADPW
jgi:hypothetical protein